MISLVNIARRLKVYAFVMFLLCSGCAQGSDPRREGTVPKLVSEYMAEVQCKPIRDYYADYAVVSPPYAWIEYHGVMSFAVVCDKNDSDNLYWLALVTRPLHEFSKCPREFPLRGKPVKVLAQEPRRLGDDSYFEVAGGRSVNIGVDREAWSIEITTRDKVRAGYVCDGGKWIYTVGN